MRSFFLVAIVAISVATSVQAQDASADWDVVDKPEQKLVVASATFSSGVTVALRCLDGRYDALIGGLPEAAPGSEQRSISLQFGDEPADEREWFVGTARTTVISDLPARLARQLREGGMLKLRVQEAGEGGRRLRYDLDLPPSPGQIDRTLTACGRPTIDVRDQQVADLEENGLPGGIRWARAPEVSYPEGRTFERGFAVVSCLNEADGRLRDCVVESEFPLSGGFGEAALRSTRRARLERISDPGAEIPTRMIVYRTVFRMESFGEEAVRERSMSRIPRDP